MDAPITMPHVITTALAGLGTVVLAAAAFVYAVRKLQARIRVVVFGGLVFFVSQVLLRIPLITVAGLSLEPVLEESVAAQTVWLVVLAFSAGLFEETGRYLGYRFLLRDADPPTGRNAVAYGLGHGGTEAILLVGIGLLAQAGVYWFLTEGGLAAFPPEARDAITAQAKAAAALPVWTPFVALVERALSMTVHVALSVIVALVLVRGGLRWLWLAIALHGLSNLIAVGYLQIASQHQGGQTPFILLTTELIIALSAAALVVVATRAWPRASGSRTQTWG